LFSNEQNFGTVAGGIFVGCFLLKIVM